MRVADNPKCIGCPLRGDGSQLYTPDRLVPGADVEVRFGTPEEARQGLPRLERDYYKLAGLTTGQVSTSSAIKCGATLPASVKPDQWDRGKRGPLEASVSYCRRAHSYSGLGMVGNQAPQLVITLGDLALQSATGQRSSHEWRGWLLPYQSPSDRWLEGIWTPGPGDLPVLAMVPLGDLFAQPNLTYGMRADWRKVGRILRQEWPQRPPELTTVPPKVWPRVSAFDTEFDPQGRLERYSLYDGETLWVVEAGSVRSLELPGEVTVVMHNVEADIAHLQEFLRGGTIKTEDTMLMHAVLWSDLPHSLEFLGSLYARTNRWKHLFYRAPLAYSGADALGTWDVYIALVGEMQSDPQSTWVYRNAVFPLTPIIMEAETVGLRVSEERVQQALAYHTALQTEVTEETMAYVGWPMNVGSPLQVADWLYNIEQVGVKKGRKR